MKDKKRLFFESLHAQYHVMVQQMCLGFVHGDREVARDLAQEVFINVWNALEQFRGSAAPKTWIYRITVNTCLQHIRKGKGKHNVSLGELEHLPEASDGTATSGHQNLYRAIGKLNEVDRLIIMMVLDELDYEDIANVVGLTPGNLRVKIHRIKKRLKNLLEHEQQLD